MWEKKDAEIPRGSQPSTGARSDSYGSPAAPSAQPSGAKGRANIGGSLFIKGEVTGSEDLIVEGRVEGKIHLKDHNLSIAASGRVSAEVHARSVSVHGEVTGNVHADEKIEISETGRLTGDLFAPRVAISDGAQFRGSVDMGRATAPAAVHVGRERSADGPPPRLSERPSERPQAQVAAQGKTA